MSNEMRFVFDRMPDADGCMFIEVEDANGNSINAGQWRARPDGLAELVIAAAPQPPALGGEVETRYWLVDVEGYKAVSCESSEYAKDTVQHYIGRSRKAELVELVDRAHVANLQAQLSNASAFNRERSEDIERLQAEVERLNALLDTPHTEDWFEGVKLEAGHQIKRWGAEHDGGKTPADWFWLIGYLSQKAMTAQMAGDDGKARHHTISTGAAMLNWFRVMVGDSNAMRPGIDAALAEGAKS